MWVEKRHQYIHIFDAELLIIIDCMVDVFIYELTPSGLDYISIIV